MLRNLSLSLLSCFFLIANAQKPDDLFIKDRLQDLSGDNIFKTEGYYNWCTSMLKGEDGKYHLFYSRWKKEYSFYGWLTHSEVAHDVSDSPAGPWAYKETVLAGEKAIGMPSQCITRRSKVLMGSTICTIVPQTLETRIIQKRIWSKRHIPAMIIPTGKSCDPISEPAWLFPVHFPVPGKEWTSHWSNHPGPLPR